MEITGSVLEAEALVKGFTGQKTELLYVPNNFADGIFFFNKKLTAG